MSLSSSYDWIVLGDHPGALLSANLVAKLGLAVLLLPKCSTQKVIFSQEGQCLDPEPNFMIGIGARDGLLRDALNRILAAPQGGDGGAEISASESLPQVLTPRSRISFAGPAGSPLRELERELPQGMERELIERAMGASSEVMAYWRQFPSRLTLDLSKKQPAKAAPASWEDLVKKVQPRAKPQGETDLLGALGYGFSSQVCEGWSAGEWVHAVALGQSGASFRGGMTAYRRLLLRSAKALGATILEDAECRRIFVENRRFAGIQVSVSGNMIVGTGCVLGSGLQEFRDRLSENGPRWARRRYSVKRPSGWRFTIALTMREEALIPGMSRRMVWKEPGAPALEIEVADPSEYGTKEPEHKLVFLRTVLPFAPETLTKAYQRTIASRMFRMATEIIPFLEYHVTRVYPDFRSAQSEMHEIGTLEKIPENLRVYEGSSRASRTGVEGIFLVSGESFSKLGSFGPTVAAMEATAWVAHRSGLAGPFA